MSAGSFTSVLGVFGGMFLWCWSLYEWRDAQQWKRATRLDDLIREFDTTPLLQIGRVVIDWAFRTVDDGPTRRHISNNDAILALRVYKSDPLTNGQYEGEQARIRDGLDALLTFFERLHVAVSTRSVEIAHARHFFRYWLWVLVTYKWHEVGNADVDTVREFVQKKGSVAACVADYIAEYGNIETIVRLCQQLGVPPPNELIERAERKRLERPRWIEPVD